MSLNMRHLNSHNTFLSHFRRTSYESINNVVAKSGGSGARVALVQILATTTNSEKILNPTDLCLEDSTMLYALSPRINFSH